jgi:hypothetical protein
VARKRLLSPQFFTSRSLAKCSRDARLLFAGLWLIADRSGRMEWTPKWVEGQIFPFDDDVDIRALVAELEAVGSVVVYEGPSGAYLAIPSWSLWQNPHKNESQSTLPAPDCDGVQRIATKTRVKRDKAATKTRAARSLPESITVSKSVSVGDRRSVALAGLEDAALDIGSFIFDSWSDRDLGPEDTFGEWVATHLAAHPGVDLLAEARKAYGWELGKSAREKKKKIRQFLSGWWGRCQPTPAPPSKPLSFEDEQRRRRGGRTFEELDAEWRVEWKASEAELVAEYAPERVPRQVENDHVQHWWVAERELRGIT